MKPTKTSWNTVSPWYNKLLDSKGSYFHEHIVIPNTLKLLELKPDAKLLDLACGNGILAQKISGAIYYQGIDLATDLIAFAKQKDKNEYHHFAVADVTKPLTIPQKDFTHAAIILALQNMADPNGAIYNAANYLKIGGKLIIVLNHPMFRIPRQSSWGIDEQNKLQYRRINRYMSPLEIPITMHPGKIKRHSRAGGNLSKWISDQVGDDNNSVTWSYHLPLSTYSEYLFKNGFLIEKIEEWTSDKESVGKAAKMENRARDEFPLFMALLCRKK